MSHKRRMLFVAGVALFARPMVVLAQAPCPVRFIVPYPPGGVVDAIARQLARALEAGLGERLVIENMPGAGGSLGLQHLLNGSGSLHDIAIGTDSDTLLVPMSNPQVKFRPADFRLVGLIGTGPMVLAVSGRLPKRAAPALVASARGSASGQLSFGNYGVDSNSHLLAQDFARRAEVNAVHVPYKGIAPLVQDLSGGHVDMAFMPLAGLAPLLGDDRIRVAGVAAASRHATMPAVETIEAAFGWQNFRYSSWAGVMVPKSMPEAIAARYSEALRGALGDAAFRTFFEGIGGALAAPLTLLEAQQYFDQAEGVYRRLMASLKDQAPGKTGS
jgi:tripartite-type tricarboxylate transporter receptor subunit TctC